MATSSPALATTMHPLIDYSRAGEPLIFARFLEESPGVLVEVGAGDGLTGSLSRELIDKDWRALLIERNPKLFSDLVENTSGLPYVRIFSELQPPGLTGAHLLLLNAVESAVEDIETLDLAHFQPQLIVTNDGTTDSAQRTKKYDLLARLGYTYSALAGEYSMWRLETAAKTPVARSKITSISENLREARGEAAFDPLPGDFELATTSGSREVMISGWAFGNAAQRVPPLVWIEISDRGGRRQYVQAHRYWRPELSARLKRRNLGMSGFRALVPLSGRPPKWTSLRVVQADGDALFRSNAELIVETTLQPFEHTAREGLARKFLLGSGIEIGALQRPLPMPRGCRVRYVDRISIEELHAHYPELGEFPLQSPDFLDDGETLSRVATSSQDFVIANHFFEHSENPIQTLTNLLRVIKPGGILYMGVPDKRYTFDFDRPVTRYQLLKQTYETKLRPDRQKLFEEWTTLSERRTGADAEARMAELIATNYSIHYNVWTFDDLLGFLSQARTDFELPFQMVSAVCCDNEAILLLERT